MSFQAVQCARVACTLYAIMQSKMVSKNCAHASFLHQGLDTVPGEEKRAYIQPASNTRGMPRDVCLCKKHGARRPRVQERSVLRVMSPVNTYTHAYINVKEVRCMTSCVY
jgi:hypothetical protein